MESLVHPFNLGEHPVKRGEVEDGKRGQYRKMTLWKVFKSSQKNHVLVDSAKRSLHKTWDNKHMFMIGGMFLPVQQVHTHSLSR